MGEVTGIRLDIFLWLLEVSSTETSMDFLLSFLAPESGWRPKGATFCRFRVCPTQPSATLVAASSPSCPNTSFISGLQVL